MNKKDPFSNVQRKQEGRERLMTWGWLRHPAAIFLYLGKVSSDWKGKGSTNMNETIQGKSR